MTGALSGLKVLDLSRILAGPTCTQLLGDMGADVVKIENPRSNGDDTRAWGPPYSVDKTGCETDLSAYFSCANRNKRSVSADLGSDDGQALIKRLAAQADVVVENFKPGGLAKYGLDYEALRQVNSRLVYCSISGFGQTGRNAHKPGYDLMAQGFGGIMSLTGQPDGEPTKVAVGIADVMCGMYATVGILAAIRHLEQTGQGQHIDIALVDSQIAWLINEGTNFLTSEKLPERRGNEHPNIAPYQVYEGSDGHVIIACGNDRQFSRLSDFLGLNKLSNDPRFSTNPARIQNREALNAILKPAFSRHSMANIMSGLEACGVPVGPVNTLDKVFESDQVEDRGMKISMENNAIEAMVPMIGNPLKFSETPVTYRRAPPTFGEHTEEFFGRSPLEIVNSALLETRAYIDGSWVSSSDTFEVANPATGQTISKVSDLGRDGAANAIFAAKSSLKNWQSLTAKQRSNVLRRLFDLIVDNTDDLARIITAEMGKPLAEAKGEVAAGAAYFEWFSEEAKRVYGDVIPGHQPDKRNFVIKQPIGVVAAITPWNFPFSMLSRKVAPALAVGCSVVSRPSELAPQTALALAVLAEEAGVPPGVFNVIPSKDAASIGQEFCENPIVAKLTFTGSTRVGRILMAQAAPTIKKLSLELGGNAPFIVFDDANLDAAVEGALASKLRNNGQTCVCANRVYAQSGIYDAFTAKLAAKFEQLNIGDGAEPGVDIGPLVNAQALAKVNEHIADASAKGAVLVCGGKPHSLGGNFIEPCVIAHATPDMLVASEETFGPLAPVFKFENEQEVIAAANDTEFGLAAYLFATDVNLIWRVSEQLEAGMVGINTGMISTEVSPFGGVKQSGIGREGSKYGLDDYLEIKSLCFGEV